MGLYIVLGIICLFGFTFAYNRYDRKKILKDIAAQYNLQYQNGTLSGKINNYTIKITAKDNDDDTYLKIHLYDFKRINIPFTLKSQSDSFAIPPKFKSGDNSFDNKIFTYNKDKNKTIAFLNEGIRNNILELTAYSHSLLISNEKILIKRNQGITSNYNHLNQAIYLLNEIIEDFNKKDDLLKRLTDNINNDSNETVRMNNMYALCALFPEDKRSIKIIKDILEGDDLTLQIETITTTKFNDYDIIADIFKRSTQEDLEKKYNQHIGDFIEYLIKMQSSATDNIIKTIMSKRLHSRYVIKCCKYCYNAGSNIFIPELLQYLNDEESTVKEDPLKALKTCGDLSVIEDLIKLKVQSMNLSWRNQIQNTIEAIQKRLSTGERGWVSVEESDDAQGSISIAKDDDGKISIADD